MLKFGLQIERCKIFGLQIKSLKGKYYMVILRQLN